MLSHEFILTCFFKSFSLIWCQAFPVQVPTSVEKKVLATILRFDENFCERSDSLHVKLALYFILYLCSVGPNDGLNFGLIIFSGSDLQIFMKSCMDWFVEKKQVVSILLSLLPVAEKEKEREEHHRYRQHKTQLCSLQGFRCRCKHTCFFRSDIKSPTGPCTQEKSSTENERLKQKRAITMTLAFSRALLLHSCMGNATVMGMPLLLQTAFWGWTDKSYIIAFCMITTRGWTWENVSHLCNRKYRFTFYVLYGAAHNGSLRDFFFFGRSLHDLVLSLLDSSKKSLFLCSLSSLIPRHDCLIIISPHYCSLSLSLFRERQKVLYDQEQWRKEKIRLPFQFEEEVSWRSSFATERAFLQQRLSHSRFSCYRTSHGIVWYWQTWNLCVWNSFETLPPGKRVSGRPSSSEREESS